MNTPGTVLWINLCLISCFKWDFHENSPVFRSVASKGRLLAMQACCQSQDDALKVKTSKRLPCLSYRLQYMQCKKIPKQIIVYSKEHCVNVIGICRNYNLANCSIFLWAVLCCVHASGKTYLFMVVPFSGGPEKGRLVCVECTFDSVRLTANGGPCMSGAVGWGSVPVKRRNRQTNFCMTIVQHTKTGSIFLGVDAAFYRHRVLVSITTEYFRCLEIGPSTSSSAGTMFREGCSGQSCVMLV